MKNRATVARPGGISESLAADIHASASLGANVIIGENVIVREGAVIGPNVILGYFEGDGPLAPTVIGENAIVRSGTVVYSDTTIGVNSTVGHNSVLREGTVIGHDTYVGTLVSIEGETVIGDHVGIQSMCYITRHCNIGDYTFIGPRFAGANDAAMSHRRSGHGQNLAGFITGKYVRIAIGVVALPGIYFGEGCIVAAGSVVTRDVPPYTLVMGVPARVVREVTHEEIEDEANIPGGKNSV